MKNSTNDGIQISGLFGEIRRCYIHDSTNNGVRCDTPGKDYDVSFLGNFIAKNGGKGISLTTGARSRQVNLDHNVIYKNTGDGITPAVTNGNYPPIAFLNNITYSTRASSSLPQS